MFVSCVITSAGRKAGHAHGQAKTAASFSEDRRASGSPVDRHQSSGPQCVLHR